MTISVAISPTPILQFFNNAGQPNNGGSILTQVGGVNYATYQDSAGITALPNPIPLNSRGEISNVSGASCQLFLEDGVVYTFTQYDSAGNQINQPLHITSVASYSTLSTSIGASLIGESNGGTVQQRFDHEIINVKNAPFNAIGNGVADDTVAIQAALAYIVSRGRGGILFFPVGNYLITDTLALNISGLFLLGEGADEGRVSWGKWPTRIVWGGTINKNMLAIDTTLTGVIRGGTISNIVIDAQTIAGVCPLYANTGSADWKLDHVCFRNYDTNVYLGTSCFGWEIDVELFNFQGIGMLLEGANHGTNFKRFRISGTSITAATCGLRIGKSDRCSGIKFGFVRLEAANTTNQVELLNCRDVEIAGGYGEINSNGINSFFLLGDHAGGTACNGFGMSMYIQGNDPTYTLNQVLDVQNASGVNVKGGHYRSITGALIKSPYACPNSYITPGIHIESVGGDGNTIKFIAGYSTGWTYVDSGTSTPALVGATTAGTNLYTTRNCQWWLTGGRIYGDVELTLTGGAGALDSTGILSIETNIPYTSAANYDYSCQIGNYSGFALAASANLRAYVARSSHSIVLREEAGGGASVSSVLNTEAGNALSVKISFNYPITPAP